MRRRRSAPGIDRQWGTPTSLGSRIPRVSLIQTLAVAEHLNFRHAVNALGVSLSSVSARCRKNPAIRFPRKGAIFGWVNCSVPYRAARVKPPDGMHWRAGPKNLIQWVTSGVVAQLGERRNRTAEVEGSTPFDSTIPLFCPARRPR